MPKLTLNRIKQCPHRGCENLGYAEDMKCYQHTSCHNTMSKPKPESMKNPFGMELEFYFRYNSGRTVRNNIEKLAYFIGTDGSLSSNGHGYEIKVLNEAGKVGRSAGYILNSMKQQAELFVDRTCGTHVHVNIKEHRQALINYQQYRAVQYINEFYFEKRNIAEKLFPYLNPIQDEISSIFPGRVSGGGYSRKIQNANQLYEDRYLWAAISPRYPTIELRLHPGTINADIAIAWSKCCIQLQKLFKDILSEKTNDKTRAAKRGKFFTQFQKGTVARHYIDYRRNVISNRGTNSVIEQEYTLPCS